MLVEEIFNEKMFPDFQLLGGASGIKNRITSVEICDTPDQHFWTRGGDFVITNGFFLKEDPSAFYDIFCSIAQRGAAAFGVKFDRFIFLKDLPKIMELSDELGLPLFNIPWNYSWNEIITKITLLINQKNHPLNPFSLGTLGTLGTLDNLENLIDIFSNQEEPFSFMRTFSNSLNKIIIIKRLPFHPLIFVPGEKISCSIQDILHRYMETPPSETSIISSTNNYCVRREKRVYEMENLSRYIGSIVYSKDNNPSFEVHIIVNKNESLPIFQENLVLKSFQLLQFLLQTNIQNDSTILIEKKEIVERLILGCHVDIDYIKKTIGLWGVNNIIPCRVGVSRKNQNVKDLLSNKLCKLSCSLGDLLVFIVSPPFINAENNNETNDPNNLRFFDQQNLLITFGGIAENYNEINKSFIEAKSIFLFLEKQKMPTKSYIFEDILFEHALFGFSNIEQGKIVWERYWKPIKKTSQTKILSLEDFSRCLLLSNFNLKDCAKRLRIHYNTARNYFIELEKVLGLSFEKMENRTSFHIAERVDHFQSSKFLTRVK